jgi:hypothetical protein
MKLRVASSRTDVPHIGTIFMLRKLFSRKASPPPFREAMLVIGSPATGLEFVEGRWSDERASWCIAGTDTPVTPRDVREIKAHA